MKITRKAVLDAARFSNFAQRVKMEFWKESKTYVPESVLDSILLIAWSDFKNWRGAGPRDDQPRKSATTR